MALDHYDAPDGSYTSAIPSGTAAFRKVVAGNFGYTRSEVVRDKSRCNQQRSEHCECGAIDFFTTDPIKGRTLFNWCVRNADELGVQSVIFRDRQIGFGNPTERHREKRDHFDHVHVGLNRWARRNLTEDLVRRHLPEEDELTPEQAKKLDEIWNALYEKRGGKTKEHLDILEAKLDEILSKL